MSSFLWFLLSVGVSIALGVTLHNFMVAYRSYKAKQPHFLDVAIDLTGNVLLIEDELFDEAHLTIRNNKIKAYLRLEP